MFIAACKMLITATIVNSFHKAKIVPQDECKVEVTEMLKKWQHLCQKLAVVVASDDFYWSGSRVIVEELTGENIVRNRDRKK